MDTLADIGFIFLDRKPDLLQSGQLSPSTAAAYAAWKTVLDKVVPCCIALKGAGLVQSELTGDNVEFSSSACQVHVKCLCCKC